MHNPSVSIVSIVSVNNGLRNSEKYVVPPLKSKLSHLSIISNCEKCFDPKCTIGSPYRYTTCRPIALATEAIVFLLESSPNDEPCFITKKLAILAMAMAIAI